MLEREGGKNSEVIKDRFENLFENKYGIFSNDPNIEKLWLVVLHFKREAKNLTVSYYHDRERFNFPYGNLTERFENIIEKDADTTFRPIKYKENVFIGDEEDIPSSMVRFIGMGVEKDVLDRKLKLKTGETASAARIRLFPTYEFDPFPDKPLVEYWLAQRIDDKKDEATSQNGQVGRSFFPPSTEVKRIW